MPFRVKFLIILEEEKKAPEANSLKLSRTLLGRGEGQGSSSNRQKTMETIVPEDGVFFFHETVC